MNRWCGKTCCEFPGTVCDCSKEEVKPVCGYDPMTNFRKTAVRACDAKCLGYTNITEGMCPPAYSWGNWSKCSYHGSSMCNSRRIRTCIDLTQCENKPGSTYMSMSYCSPKYCEHELPKCYVSDENGEAKLQHCKKYGEICSN